MSFDNNKNSDTFSGLARLIELIKTRRALIIFIVVILNAMYTVTLTTTDAANLLIIVGTIPLSLVAFLIAIIINPDFIFGKDYPMPSREGVLVVGDRVLVCRKSNEKMIERPSGAIFWERTMTPYLCEVASIVEIREEPVLTYLLDVDNRSHKWAREWLIKL